MSSRAYPDLFHHDAGSGTPLVLLHAFPQTHEMWARQLETLSNDFRVLCPELRVWRATSVPAIERLADVVAYSLYLMGVGKAIIGGVSMGGYVALALARRHPTMLRGLILSSTRADADSEAARAARETMIAFAKENNARAVFDKMAPRLFCATTRESRPALVEEAARIAEPISTKTIVATLEALRDRPDARAGLAQIQVPTLVLVGEEDEVSPPVVAREMAGAIPNACLQVLAGAGHFAHLEQAEAWNDAVRKFALSIDS